MVSNVTGHIRRSAIPDGGSPDHRHGLSKLLLLRLCLCHEAAGVAESERFQSCHSAKLHSSNSANGLPVSERVECDKGVPACRVELSDGYRRPPDRQNRDSRRSCSPLVLEGR